MTTASIDNTATKTKRLKPPTSYDFINFVIAALALGLGFWQSRQHDAEVREGKISEIIGFLNERPSSLNRLFVSISAAPDTLKDSARSELKESWTEYSKKVDSWIAKIDSTHRLIDKNYGKTTGNYLDNIYNKVKNAHNSAHGWFCMAEVVSATCGKVTGSKSSFLSQFETNLAEMNKSVKQLTLLLE
jgi:hypothetical protein